MDYKQMTAPCGRDCFNCLLYLARENQQIRRFMANKFNIAEELADCEGCRNIEGKCKLFDSMGFSDTCKTYKCSMEKKVDFCYECNDFPCDLLHPLADRADLLPHNLKVYNLCMIKKMGVEEWAKNKAKESFEKYYNSKLDL